MKMERKDAKIIRPGAPEKQQMWGLSSRTQGLERWDGGSGRYGLLWRSFTVLQSIREHFHGLTGVRWNEDRGRKQAAANPSLPGVGKTVAAKVWEAKPTVALRFRGQFLERLARANGHGIVLRGNQIDVGFLRGGEFQPGTHGALRAFLGPLPFNHDEVNIPGLNFLHAKRAVLRRGIFRRALNVQHGTAGRKQRGALTPLNAANFHVVGTDAEHGRFARLTEFADVVCVAIKNRPANSGIDGSARYLRQCSSTDRLKNDGVRTIFLGGLNRLQDLGALIDGIVIGVENLEIHVQFTGCLLRGARLFDLIIVVVRGQRNQKL